MEVAHEGLERKAFPRPDGIVGPIDICTVSGKLPNELCSEDPRGSMVRKEIFIKGTQPKEVCDVHVEELVDSSTGLIATSNCPLDLIESQVFIKRPIPYQVAPNGQKPLDAQYEVPTEVCDVHETPPWPFPDPDEEEDPWEDEEDPWDDDSDPVYYYPEDDYEDNHPGERDNHRTRPNRNNNRD